MKIRVKKSAKTKENMLQIAKKIDFKKIFEAIKKKREKCALLWIKFAFNELPLLLLLNLHSLFLLVEFP